MDEYISPKLRIIIVDVSRPVAMSLTGHTEQTNFIQSPEQEPGESTW